MMSVIFVRLARELLVGKNIMENMLLIPIDLILIMIIMMIRTDY